MQNNIDDINSRRNFIKNASHKQLNDYLKMLEKLSKKGGKYLEIYNADIQFILDMSDNEIASGSSLLGNFTRNPTDSEVPLNTVMCLNKINNMTQSAQHKWDNEIVRLNTIKSAINSDKSIDGINNFVGFIFEMGSNKNGIFNSDIYKDIEEAYFKPIITEIIKSRTRISHIYKIFSKLDKAHSQYVDNNFVVKYTKFKATKTTDPNYKENKQKFNKLNDQMLGTFSFFVSCLVGKILINYKRYATQDKLKTK